MIKKTTKSTAETTFHGTTIKTSIERLKKLFPDSYIENNNGEDKINFKFSLELDSGDVFTVYDWKQYHPLQETEEIAFNIGGENVFVTETAKNEINKLIDDLLFVE